MKKFYLALLLLAALFYSPNANATITCGISLVSDTGCSPLPLLASSTGTSSAPLTYRRWTLRTCAGVQVSQSLTQAPQAINNPNFSYIANVTSCTCYNLELEERNNLGEVCTTVYSNITVAVPPTVTVAVSDSSGCAPHCLTFTVTINNNCSTVCSGNIDWGDGNVDPIPALPAGPGGINTYNASHCYTIPGTFSPNVTVTNCLGCSRSIAMTNAISVIAPINASFTSSNNFVNCAPAGSQVAATFNAVNAGPGMTYTWFVDGVQQQSGSSTTFNQNFVQQANCYDIRLLVNHISGCSDDTIKLDNVCVTPQPVLSINPLSNNTVCIPSNVVFTSNTPGLQQLTGTLSCPSGNFTQSGTNSLTFSIINPGCCTLTAVGDFGAGCTDTVVVPNAVCGATFNGSPNFVANDTFGCQTPHPVTFTTTAPVPCPGCTYQWNFGSSSAVPATSTSANPSVVYNQPGNFTVSLTITQNGCSRTTTKNAYIKVERLNSTFTLSTTKGCAPLCPTLQSTTTSTDPIATYEWITPGAVPSTGNTQIFNTCYSTPGSYTVALYTTTTTGCSDTTFLIDTIDVGVEPVCTFTANPDTMCYEADTVAFNATCVPVPDFCIINYGDGNTGIVLTFPHEYIYQDLGDFEPFMVCYVDSCPGDTMYLTHPLVVLPPAANFDDSITCALGDTIYLKNLTQQATSYRWYFGCTGDSLIGLTDARVLLPRCDTCSVTLVAFNDTSGCEHKKSQLLNTPCDSVSFIPRDIVVCSGVPVNFVNTSAYAGPPNPANYTLWDFNGPPFGQQATGPSVNRTFTTGGTVLVGMRNISPISGCIDTIWDTIYVCQPTASFTANPSSICVPGTVTFTNTSTFVGCSASSFLWNFGDGVLDSTNFSTTHEYTVPGSYTVTLTITAGNCTRTVTSTVTAAAAISDIVYDSLSCVGAPVNFSVQPIVPGVNYSWQFPGAFPSNSTSPNPTVTYISEGVFPAIVTANNGSCTAIDTAWMTIANPVADGAVSVNFFPCPDPSIIVLYTDSSTNDVVDWNWNFGDGSSALHVPNVAHTYSFAGTYPICLTVTSEDGCVATSCIDTIQVDGPSGTYSFNPTPGVCVCDSVDITITTVGASSMTFVYGCNLGFYQDTAISPVGTISSPRTFGLRLEYCVVDACQPQLIFGDSTGCTVFYDNLQQYIYIDSPDIDFAIQPYNTCDSGQVCFSDSTTYNLDSLNSFTLNRYWSFGDGGTDSSNALNPCHYYTQPGTYIVTLSIESNLGCYRELTDTVIIPESPDVAIAANDSIVCAPDSVCFTDLTVIDPNTISAFRVWDYGDGNIDSSNSATPCHYYTTAGTFVVRLCVTDTFGCVGCDSLIIQVIQPPVALAGNDTTLCFGSSLQLNGQGGVTCSWEPAGLFPNPNICNPFIQANTPDTSYILTVTDLYGCTGNDTFNLTIARVFADFNGGEACIGDSICVTDASTGVNDSLVSWVYNFGDFTPVQNGPDTCHTYTSPGTFNVTLTVTDNFGCSNSMVDSIIVHRKPRARFSRDSVCKRRFTTFTDLSDPGTTSIVSWNWDFGDGNFDTIQNPQHLYDTAGVFTVTLTVCNDEGCCDDTTLPVTVYEIPIADFTTNVVCFGGPTIFLTNSTAGSGAINQNFWDFDIAVPGGDTSVNLGSATYTYPAALAHNALLIVSDVNGCADTITKTVFVNTLPVADWSAGIACDNQPVQLNDQTTPGTSPLTGWTWTFFPCQGLPNVQNPTINCSAAGTFQVCLEVIDTAGCQSDTCKPLTINTSPSAAFSTNDTTLCANDALCVTDLSTAGSTSILNWGWSYGDGNTAAGQAPPCYNYTQPLANGYVVTLGIIDQNGCTDTASLPITVNDYPTADFDYTVVCEGNATPFSQTSVPGDGTLNFCEWIFWVGSANPIVDNSCNPSFTFPAGGIYDVQLTIGDNNGCFHDTILPVLVDTPSLVQLNPGDTTICLGESIDYTVQGIYDNVTWVPPVWISDPNSPNVQINPLGDIAYIISGVNGTCAEDTTMFTVNVIQPIPIDVTATPQQIILGISSNITSSIPGTIDSIIWSPDSTLDCRDCQNPIATPTQTTTYTATIYYSEDGITCTNSAQVTITVLLTCNNDIIYIPNTFTPNGDGLNDRFMIRGIGLTKINFFRIFDRWGKLVYEVSDGVPNDPNFGWDGNDRNGEKLNPAVFVYHYEIECANQDVVTGKGNITLIR